MKLSDDVRKYYAELAEEYDTTAGYRDCVAEGLRSGMKARFKQALRGQDVLEIACGTGYWTKVIAGATRWVVATDSSPKMISMAQKRLVDVPNVRCQVADAYSLAGISGDFTAAFAHWWWSHMPKSRIKAFLDTLHTKLLPGAFILFVDQLPYECPKRRYDEEGNLLEERTLADGRRFEIVKNFPTEQEIMDYLAGIAEGVSYTEYPGECYWRVSYNTKKA